MFELLTIYEYICLDSFTPTISWQWSDENHLGAGRMFLETKRTGGQIIKDTRQYRGQKQANSRNDSAKISRIERPGSWVVTLHLRKFCLQTAVRVLPRWFIPRSTRPPAQMHCSARPCAAAPLLHDRNYFRTTRAHSCAGRTQLRKGECSAGHKNVDEQREGKHMSSVPDELETPSPLRSRSRNFQSLGLAS